MGKSSLEKVVEKGISFLSKIFPFKTYLYFPLLYTSFIWAIKRVKEWKEEIFSWKVWLDPDRIEIKPDEFILNFFETNPALNKTYEVEIKKKDLVSLRKNFFRLYPIIGLEDPFLSALFYEELKSGDFEKIVKEFEERISQAEKDIEAFNEKLKLLEGLKSFANEMVSLNLDLFSQDKVQDIFAGLIKKSLMKNDE